MRLDIADAASGASRIIGEDFLRLDIADAASLASRIIGEDSCTSMSRIREILNCFILLVLFLFFS